MKHLDCSIDDAKRLIIHLKPDVKCQKNLSTKMLARKGFDIIEWLRDNLTQCSVQQFIILGGRRTCSSLSVQRLEYFSVISWCLPMLSLSPDVGVSDRGT